MTLQMYSLEVPVIIIFISTMTPENLCHRMGGGVRPVVTASSAAFSQLHDDLGECLIACCFGFSFLVYSYCFGSCFHQKYLQPLSMPSEHLCVKQQAAYRQIVTSWQLQRGIKNLKTDVLHLSIVSVMQHSDKRQGTLDSK